jgi:hypothetical protein
MHGMKVFAHRIWSYGCDSNCMQGLIVFALGLASKLDLLLQRLCPHEMKVTWVQMQAGLPESL